MTGWIPIRERMPTRDDADQWGCVLIWDVYNGVKVCGYNNHQGLTRGPVTHWRRVPDGPGVTGEEDDCE